MKTRLRWIAGAALAVAGFAAVPAQAHTDLAIGVTLGGPTYYAPPAPRYYEREVVYERPVVRYYEPVVYERDYCPPRRVYVEERVYRKHHKHHRHDWDD